MTFERQFQTCSMDSIWINFTAWGDDSIEVVCDGINLTGGVIPGGASFNLAKFDGSGTIHRLDITLVVRRINLNNPTGLIVSGSVRSKNGTLMQKSQISPITAAYDSACVGQTITLADATPGGTWSSSNPGVATVNASTGVVMGMGAGTATIIYTVGNVPCPARFVVTVVEQPKAGSLKSRKVCANDAPFFTGFNTPGTPGGTWSAGPSSIGSVDPFGTITLTGTAGTLNVTYTAPAPSSCSPSIATATITVNPAPLFFLTPLPPEGDVCTGNSYTLCVVGIIDCPGCSYLWDWGETSGECVTHPPVSFAGLDRCSPMLYTDSLSLTNSAGCKTTETVTVNIWPHIDPVPISGPTRACSGDKVQYSVPPRGCTGIWSISPLSPDYGIYIEPTTGLLHCGADIDAVPENITVVVQHTIPNPGCGSDTSIFLVTIYPVPYVTVSLEGTCNPICPGSLFNILFHGNPNAKVTYTWTDPGGVTSVSSWVTLNASGNGVDTAMATAVGTASISIVSVTLPDNQCQRRPPKPFPINIAYPSCNLVLADSAHVLCAGTPFRVWVSGSPGIYSIHADPGIDFEVTVPDDGSPVLSPWLTTYLPTLECNICVMRIIGCSCTVEIDQNDHPLCCLNVIANARPQIDLSHSGACPGHPFSLDAWVETTSTPVSQLDWYSPSGGLYATTSPVSYGDNYTSPTTATGVFSVTATAANGCKAMQTINVTPTPTAHADLSVSGALCAGTLTTVSVTVTGTPGTYGNYIVYPYFVSGSFPAIPSSGSEVLTFSATVPVAGTLTVVVTSLGNYGYCIDNGPYDTLFIPVNPAPVITLVASTNPCGDQRLIFNGTPLGSIVSYETGGIAQPDIILIAGGVSVPESVAVPTVYKITNVVSPLGCHMPGPLPIVTLDTMSLYACVQEQRNPYLTGYMFTGTPGALLSIYYIGEDGLGNPATGTTVISLSIPGGTYFLPYSSFLGLINISAVYITSIDYTAPDGSTCSATSTCSRASRPYSNYSSIGTNADDIKIHPNPNNGSFNISGSLSPDKNSSLARIDVLDVVGRVVYSTTATIKDGAINTDITLDPSIADGTYIMRVSNGSSMKVIKMTIVK